MWEDAERNQDTKLCNMYTYIYMKITVRKYIKLLRVAMTRWQNYEKYLSSMCCYIFSEFETMNKYYFHNPKIKFKK